MYLEAQRIKNVSHWSKFDLINRKTWGRRKWKKTEVAWGIVLVSLDPGVQARLQNSTLINFWSLSISWRVPIWMLRYLHESNLKYPLINKKQLASLSIPWETLWRPEAQTAWLKCGLQPQGRKSNLCAGSPAPSQTSPLAWIMSSSRRQAPSTKPWYGAWKPCALCIRWPGIKTPSMHQSSPSLLRAYSLGLLIGPLSCGI